MGEMYLDRETMEIPYKHLSYYKSLLYFWKYNLKIQIKYTLAWKFIILELISLSIYSHIPGLTFYFILMEERN